MPSALEAVLSSTDASIRDWQKTLKYAIMDEVHCIGEEKTGRECENLIQLLPCPFMALSATVGNESDFSDWLSRAQSFRGAQPLKFIKHDERCPTTYISICLLICAIVAMYVYRDV